MTAKKMTSRVNDKQLRQQLQYLKLPSILDNYEPEATIAAEKHLPHVEYLGRLIEADTVIIAIGERPDLSYIPREWLNERGMAEVDDCGQLTKAAGIFAIGDTISPGLLTHAIGHGREAAEYIDDILDIVDQGGVPTSVALKIYEENDRDLVSSIVQCAAGSDHVATRGGGLGG